MATATKKEKKRKEKRKLTLGRTALIAGKQQTYFETFNIYALIK
jgi:hypothetical protein